MNCKILALALCLFGQGTIAQTTVDVPIDEARVIATRALFAGETELALNIARGLLQIDPDDRDALLIVAAAAPRLGAPTDGRRAGARAFALSQTDAQRYEAARLTALAAANEKRFTLATFWLRRALIVVPNDEERQRNLRDAAGLRRVNPWSTNLGFSIVPSNNINGGADEEVGSDGGRFSQSATALDGVRATLNFSTRYRLPLNDRSRLTFGLQYQEARVSLSNEGEVDQPGITSTTPAVLDGGGMVIIPATTRVIREETTLNNEDFGSRYGEISLGYDLALQNGTFGVSGAKGRVDFGGELYYEFNRIGLSRSFAVGERTFASLGVQQEVQDFASPTLAEVKKLTWRSALSYRLGNDDRIGFSLQYSDAQSDNTNAAFDDWTVRTTYTFSEPLGPISLSGGAGYRWTDYPDYRLIFANDGGRQDETFLYNANVGFPDIEYAGFTPSLTISGSNADSNFDRFTRSTLSVALTIDSAF